MVEWYYEKFWKSNITVIYKNVVLCGVFLFAEIFWGDGNDGVTDEICGGIFKGQ